MIPGVDVWRRRARLHRAVVVFCSVLLATTVPSGAGATTSDPSVGAGALQGTVSALLVARELTAPRIVDVVPAGPEALTVSWQPTTAPTDGTLRVVAAVAGDELTRIASSTPEPDAASARLSGLHVSPGQPVTVWIEVDTDGWVAQSPAVVAQLAPAEIETITVSAVYSDGATIAWDPPEHATAYDVQVSTDPTFATVADVTTRQVVGHQLVIGSLPTRTRHFVRVRPTNGPLTGSFSPTVFFVTNVAPTAGAAAMPATRSAPAPAPAPAATVTTPAGATELRVGSWNVCSQACSGYGMRAPLAARRLAAADVDVFALQEAGGRKVSLVTDAVFGRGANGYVRAAGGDKRGFVFYRAAQYTQGGGGHVDLGDDRHMSWAQLTDRRTGTSFVVASIHLESGKDGVDGERAAETRIALKALATVSHGLPTVLAGDFNTGPHRGKDTPSTLMAAAGLVDTRTRSLTPPVGADYNTAHSWKPSDLSRHGDHIDRIMVTGQFAVTGWMQLLHLTGDGRSYATPMVSDHNAITADLVLRPR